MASGTITNLPASLKASVDTLNAQVGTVPSGKTVQGQIDSLNSNMPTVKSVSTGISNVNAYIYGRVAFLLISYTCEASKGWQTIGTLPSGLCPISDTYISVAMTSTDNAFALVQIRSNGIIRVYNPNTTANPIGGSATYITHN